MQRAKRPCKQFSLCLEFEKLVLGITLVIETKNSTKHQHHRQQTSDDGQDTDFDAQRLSSKKILHGTKTCP